ncbi:PAS domain S-box protein [Halomicroarcula sp. GCM10025710]
MRSDRPTVRSPTRTSPSSRTSRPSSGPRFSARRPRGGNASATSSSARWPSSARTASSGRIPTAGSPTSRRSAKSCYGRRGSTARNLLRDARHAGEHGRRRRGVRRRRRRRDGPRAGARLVDGDGEEFDVAVSATPIREDGETVVVQGFARDVTERKQRERDLQRSRELFDGLVEHFPNGGVFLFDEALRFTVVGGDELENGGLSAEEMVGKRPADVFPPANAAVLEDAYRAALAGEEQSFEDSHQGRDYHVQVLPIHDEDGAVAAGMAVAQNITDRNQTREVLEQQNRQLEEFAAVVSHDLRGPLNVATGRLALARQTGENEHLDEVERAHERMSELVESLLRWPGRARPSARRPTCPSRRCPRRAGPPSRRGRPASASTVTAGSRPTTRGSDRCSRICSGTPSNTGPTASGPIPR